MSSVDAVGCTGTRASSVRHNPGPFPRARGLAELVLEAANAHPERPAVAYPDGQWTLAELVGRAQGFAAALHRKGIGDGDVVALYGRASAAAVAAQLGVVWTGAAYLPLDAASPAARSAQMIADAGARLLIALDAAPDLGIDVLDERGTAGPTVAPATGGDRPAYVMFTSGSTGRPKGIVVPHRAVVRLVRGTDYLQLGPDDVVAQVSNLSFDASTFEVWGALLNGAQLVGIDATTLVEPIALRAALHRNGVTAMFLTTAVFCAIARRDPATFGSLRALLFGGEAIDPAAVRAVLGSGHAPDHLVHVYGPTETTTFATWHPVRDVPPGVTTVPIGGPIRNTSTFVLDDAGQPVPVGDVGELWIGGDGVALGYVGDAGDRFVTDASGDRRYRTGDRVRVRADGDLEFVGRVDHQVKLRGFRIELGEVEAALRGCAGVDEAVAVVRDHGGERRLVAFVAPSGEERALRQALADAVPAWMVPERIAVLDALPLGPTGKIDRDALVLPETRAADGPASFVDTARRIWREVLGQPEVRDEDGFLELGGHSLRAVQVAARMREELGTEVAVRDLYEIRTFAEWVARAGDAQLGQADKDELEALLAELEEGL